MGMTKLFDLLHDKMQYDAQRQAVIAKNIASANIANYKPQDLESFSSVLKNKMAGSPAGGVIQVTNAKHMTGLSSNAGFKVAREKDLYEVKPAGNGVVMEQQMTQLTQTNSDYAMIASLYKKMIGLVKMSLGNRG